MNKNKITFFLPLVAFGLIVSLSGCYTRVASYDEDGTTFWDRDQDTTYQAQSYENNDVDRYGDHTYLGFDYYAPSPYWGYDSWYYNTGYYNSLWYNSPWYYGAAFVGYPFLYYPHYPYLSYYHHHGYYYGGYGNYGYGSYASGGAYGGTRNSGYTRRGSLTGLFNNPGRGSSQNGAGYVPAIGNGNALPSRGGSQSTGINTNGSTRVGRSGAMNSGNYTAPARSTSGRTVRGGSNVRSQNQSTPQQAASRGTNRGGGYARSAEPPRGGGSRPAYVPSYTPSRASAPHYTPPPSNSGRSSGGENRSSGGTRGKGR